MPLDDAAHLRTRTSKMLMFVYVGESLTDFNPRPSVHFCFSRLPSSTCCVGGARSPSRLLRCCAYHRFSSAAEDDRQETTVRGVSLLIADDLGCFLLARRIFTAFSYLDETIGGNENISPVLCASSIWWPCRNCGLWLDCKIVDESRSSCEYSGPPDIRNSEIDYCCGGLPSRRKMSLGSNMLI